jgi:hypothetical protein
MLGRCALGAADVNTGGLLAVAVTVHVAREDHN